ncbi:hypothetical protein D3C78_1215030 [compost metagenome]
MATVDVEAEALAAAAPHGLAQQRLRPLHDDAGKIPAGDAWHRGVGEAPEHVLHIAGIQARRADLDQHLAGLGYRGWQVNQVQRVETAGGRELQCLHDFSGYPEEGRGRFSI